MLTSVRTLRVSADLTNRLKNEVRALFEGCLGETRGRLEFQSARDEQTSSCSHVCHPIQSASRNSASKDTMNAISQFHSCFPQGDSGGCRWQAHCQYDNVFPSPNLCQLSFPKRMPEYLMHYASASLATTKICVGNCVWSSEVAGGSQGRRYGRSANRHHVPAEGKIADFSVSSLHRY